MSKDSVYKINNNLCVAIVTDGELLDKLKYEQDCLAHLDGRRTAECPLETQKTLDRINCVKVQMLVTIQLLEEIGYDCSYSRSLI